MKYGALLGWGIVIYAISALVASGLITYALTGTLLERALILLSVTVVALIAGRALRLHSWKDILPYSLGWGCIMIVLDAFFSVPFTGWELYRSGDVWLGYALVIVAPLLTSRKGSHTEGPRIS